MPCPLARRHRRLPALAKPLWLSVSTWCLLAPGLPAEASAAEVGACPRGRAGRSCGPQEEALLLQIGRASVEPRLLELVQTGGGADPAEDTEEDAVDDDAGKDAVDDEDVDESGLCQRMAACEPAAPVGSVCGWKGTLLESYCFVEDNGAYICGKGPYGGMCKGGCFKTETFLYPDLEGHTWSTEGTVFNCQARCARTPLCFKFTYWAADGHCHLHGETSYESKSIGAVVGPASCALAKAVGECHEETAERAGNGAVVQCQAEVEAIIPKVTGCKNTLLDMSLLADLNASIVLDDGSPLLPSSDSVTTTDVGQGGMSVDAAETLQSLATEAPTVMPNMSIPLEPPMPESTTVPPTFLVTAAPLATAAPPTVLVTEAPPTVLVTEAPPTVLVPGTTTAPPTVLVTEAPPTVLVTEAPPTVLVPGTTAAPPTVLVTEAPPTVLVTEAPPTVLVTGTTAAPPTVLVTEAPPTELQLGTTEGTPAAAFVGVAGHPGRLASAKKGRAAHAASGVASRTTAEVVAELRRLHLETFETYQKLLDRRLRHSEDGGPARSTMSDALGEMGALFDGILGELVSVHADDATPLVREPDTRS